MFVVEIDVNVPLTVKLPVTVASPDTSKLLAITTSLSPSIVRPVPVEAVSVIPVDVRSVNTAVLAEAAPIAVPSILPPSILAVSATNESMFAVPSMNRSPHSLVEEPRLYTASVNGSKLDLTPAVIVTSSVDALPITVLPLNVAVFDAVSVVNEPAAAVVPPITELSTVPSRIVRPFST